MLIFVGSSKVTVFGDATSYAESSPYPQSPINDYKYYHLVMTNIVMENHKTLLRTVNR